MLQTIVDYIRDHPGSSTQDIVEGLPWTDRKSMLNAALTRADELIDDGQSPRRWFVRGTELNRAKPGQDFRKQIIDNRIDIHLRKLGSGFVETQRLRWMGETPRCHLPGEKCPDPETACACCSHGCVCDD